MALREVTVLYMLTDADGVLRKNGVGRFDRDESSKMVERVSAGFTQ